MEVQTGVKIGHTCLHRLVEKQEWSEPHAKIEVKETSIDGGKVRLRGKLGEGSHWQDYKAVRLHESYYGAFYQDNEALINYINHQPLADILTCLGDGHEGIWKIISQLNPGKNRREILDWYHLIENLYKVGGSLKRRALAKELLWQGRVEPTLDLFKHGRQKKAQNFCKYLEKHRYRIVNYEQLSQDKICSPRLGSGGIDG